MHALSHSDPEFPEFYSDYGRFGGECFAMDNGRGTIARVPHGGLNNGTGFKWAHCGCLEGTESSLFGSETSSRSKG